MKSFRSISEKVYTCFYLYYRIHSLTFLYIRRKGTFSHLRNIFIFDTCKFLNKIIHSVSNENTSMHFIWFNKGKYIPIRSKRIFMSKWSIQPSIHTSSIQDFQVEIKAISNNSIIPNIDELKYQICEKSKGMRSPLGFRRHTASLSHTRVRFLPVGGSRLLFLPRVSSDGDDEGKRRKRKDEEVE